MCPFLSRAVFHTRKIYNKRDRINVIEETSANPRTAAVTLARGGDAKRDDVSTLVPKSLVTVPLRGHRGTSHPDLAFFFPLPLTPVPPLPPLAPPSRSVWSLDVPRARVHARGRAWTGTAKQSKRDKIYKYVGGARDPFQCLFNQE